MVTLRTGVIGAAPVRLFIKGDGKSVEAFDRNTANRILDDIPDRIALVQGDLGIFSPVLRAGG